MTYGIKRTVMRRLRSILGLRSSNTVTVPPCTPCTGVRPRLMPPAPKTLAQGSDL